MIKLFLLILLTAGCSTVQESPVVLKSNPTCEKRALLPRVARERRVYFSYCYYRFGSNPDVIYFNHGLLNSHEALHKKIFVDTSFFNFQKTIALLGTDSPSILSISFGKRWILTNGKKTKSPRESTLENYKRIMDYLEAKFKLKPVNRYVMGISMGGFNSLQLIMFMPKLFTKAVVINPVMTKCNAWDFMDVVMSHFSQEQCVLQNPLGALGSSRFSSSTPPVQLQRSLKDKLTKPGMSKKLYEIMKSRGVNVENVENSKPGTKISGGHGEFIPEKIVEFLLNKPSEHHK